MIGVIKAEEITHFLPRVGMKCRFIYDDGEAIVYSSSYSTSYDKVEFSETDELKKYSTYFTLEKTGEDKTKLTIDYYIQKSFLSEKIFNLAGKKEMEEKYHKSLQNLEEVIKQIKI
jgi:hypothetical protein